MGVMQLLCFSGLEPMRREREQAAEKNRVIIIQEETRAPESYNEQKTTTK